MDEKKFQRHYGVGKSDITGDTVLYYKKIIK